MITYSPFKTHVAKTTSVFFLFVSNHVISALLSSVNLIQCYNTSLCCTFDIILFALKCLCNLIIDNDEQHDK